MIICCVSCHKIYTMSISCYPYHIIQVLSENWWPWVQINIAPSADGPPCKRVDPPHKRLLSLCLWVLKGQSEVFGYGEKYHNMSITSGSVSQMIERSYFINDADQANIARSTVHKNSVEMVDWVAADTRHMTLATPKHSSAFSVWRHGISVIIDRLTTTSTDIQFYWHLIESCTCEVTIREELPESMMVVVDIVGEAKQRIDKWLGDTGSSHHIKSTRENSTN